MKMNFFVGSHIVIVTSGQAITDFNIENDVVDDVDVAKVNTLLQRLEGQAIDYYSYARDTPKGKDCICTLEYCRASTLVLDTSSSCGNGKGNLKCNGIVSQFSES